MSPLRRIEPVAALGLAVFRRSVDGALAAVVAIVALELMRLM